MENKDDLSNYITKTAIAEGALLVGFTKIRVIEPVIVFAFPFTDKWFLKRPLNVAKMIKKEYALSKHIQNITSKILKSEGYTAKDKSILSIYGDFRPLAVSAGLGKWGRNGIVVNNDYGAGLLFAATFTNAPIKKMPLIECINHCTGCNQCISACPGNAFENNTFHTYRCIPNAIKGCSECLKICTKKNFKKIE
ncbi:4Fe-4S binding protein [Clostridium psychrophilum]|uniref:4Fe-4S binding protein n=1 Tax=Clostridium psychrophilum TaxID=132926 RepID=UPI001C0E5593|nr:4Fe-4S binding protein [Clostridium psychrophilum]MBU3180250.1 4Fe-4S binding protein [Clostridium psychrophilum]